MHLTCNPPVFAANFGCCGRGCKLGDDVTALQAVAGGFPVSLTSLDLQAPVGAILSVRAEQKRKGRGENSGFWKRGVLMSSEPVVLRSSERDVLRTQAGRMATLYCKLVLPSLSNKTWFQQTELND